MSTKQSDGRYQDFFFLHRNSINYAVLITQRKRDQVLITRTTKSLRFTVLQHEHDRAEAGLQLGSP